MDPIQFLDSRAAFALRVKQLQDLLGQQMADAMQEQGMTLNAKTTGIVQLLYSQGPQSQADIAARLLYSHQLAGQRLSWLFDNSLAVSEPDPSDRRRRIVRLTDAGVDQARQLQQFLPVLAAAYGDLFAELQLDLDEAVQRANSVLKAKPLAERMVPAGAE